MVVGEGEEVLDGLGRDFTVPELVVDVLDGDPADGKTLGLPVVEQIERGRDRVQELPRRDEDVVGLVVRVAQRVRGGELDRGVEHARRGDREITSSGFGVEAEARRGGRLCSREPARLGLGHVEHGRPRPQAGNLGRAGGQERPLEPSRLRDRLPGIVDGEAVEDDEGGLAPVSPTFVSEISLEPSRSNEAGRLRLMRYACLPANCASPTSVPFSDRLRWWSSGLPDSEAPCR